MSDASQGPGWWQASDGKWYPPETAAGAAAPPPPGYAPPPEVKKGMPGCLKWGLVSLVIVVVLGVGCTALLSEGAKEVSKNIDQSLEEQKQDALDDVELVDCTTDDLGFMAATLKVTNDSSERSNYIIDVTFTSPDGAEQYGSGGALVSALAPDQTKQEKASSLEEAPPGEFECKITDVLRTTDE